MEKRYKIFSVLLIFTIVFIVAVDKNTENHDETNTVAVENQQQRAFYNLGNQAESLQISLSKILVGNSLEQKMVLLIDVYQDVASIQYSLSELQTNQENLTMTKRFFNQLSDYCYLAMIDQIYVDGDQVVQNSDNMELQTYKEYAVIFAQQVKQAQKLYRDDQIVMGMSLNNKIKDIYKPNSGEAEYYLYDFENRAKEYYKSNTVDNYFKNTIDRKVKGLTGKDIGAFEAKEKVKKYMIQNVKRIQLLEFGKSSGQTGIPVYVFSANTNDGKIITAISKQGGNLIYMQNTRAVSALNIVMEEAQKKAEEYMKNLGYENIKLIDYQMYSGNVTFHYANIINGIIVYPEKLNVRVALDNGEILGVDVSEYYYNHCDRDIDFMIPKIIISQAKSSIGKDVMITEQNTVIISGKNNQEILCYEFILESGEEKYAVYVNAKTGKQETVYKLITNDDGTKWV